MSGTQKEGPGETLLSNVPPPTQETFKSSYCQAPGPLLGPGQGPGQGPGRGTGQGQ